MDQSLETPGERRERYLHHAAEAETAAFRCGDGRIRAAYVYIAESWTALANEFCAPGNDLVKMGSDAAIRQRIGQRNGYALAKLTRKRSRQPLSNDIGQASRAPANIRPTQDHPSAS